MDKLSVNVVHFNKIIMHSETVILDNPQNELKG